MGCDLWSVNVGCGLWAVGCGLWAVGRGISMCCHGNVVDAITLMIRTGNDVCRVRLGKTGLRLCSLLSNCIKLERRRTMPQTSSIIPALMDLPLTKIPIQMLHLLVLVPQRMR